MSVFVSPLLPLVAVAVASIRCGESVIQAAAAAAATSSSSSSSSSRRSSSSSSWRNGGGSGSHHERKQLLLEEQYGYEITADVSKAIDLARDRALMISLFRQRDETASAWNRARAVYEQGAHAAPYAVLTVSHFGGVPADVPAGTAVMVGPAADAADGNDNDDDSKRMIAGIVMEDIPSGGNEEQQQIKIRYDHGSSTTSHSNKCIVGGSPSPDLSGCFAPSGEIDIALSAPVGFDGTTFEEGSGGVPIKLTYHYDPAADNKNALSLAACSTAAADRMKLAQTTTVPCPDCPVYYPQFQAAVDYYGTTDFANQWIEAAFDAGSTVFADGNADFSRYHAVSRADAVQAATAYLVLGMEMYREMNRAIDLCDAGCIIQDDATENGDACSNSNSDDGSASHYAMQALDVAVAHYRTAFSSFADRMCREFQTCQPGQESTTTAKSNLRVFEEFASFREMIAASRCRQAEASAHRATAATRIPLVQSALYFLRRLQLLSRQRRSSSNNPAAAAAVVEAEAEADRAVGAAVAAALLPAVHRCSADDAYILYEFMKVDGNDDETNNNSKAVDSMAVKLALQSNYDCLGITCNDIGTLYRGSGQNNTSTTSSNVNVYYNDETGDNVVFHHNDDDDEFWMMDLCLSRDGDGDDDDANDDHDHDHDTDGGGGGSKGAGVGSSSNNDNDHGQPPIHYVNGSVQGKEEENNEPQQQQQQHPNGSGNTGWAVALPAILLLCFVVMFCIAAHVMVKPDFGKRRHTTTADNKKSGIVMSAESGGGEEEEEEADVPATKDGTFA